MINSQLELSSADGSECRHIKIIPILLCEILKRFIE